MKRTLQGYLIHMSYLSVTMTQLAANFTDIHFLTSVKKMPK